MALGALIGNMIRSISQKGFSTIEILIAFAVGIIFLSAAMMVAFSGQQSLSASSAGIYNGTSTDTGQAAALDLALDNYGLATSSNRIGKIVANLVKSWNIPSGDGDGEEKINNSLTYGNASSIQDISPCMKEITSTTTWSSLNNRDHHITFGTAIGSIEQAKLYGPGGCDPTPPGEWNYAENPEWQTSPSLIVGTLTGIDVATINSVPYVFITTNETSTDNKDDLWVINVSITSTPVFVKSLETGNASSTKGLNDVSVVTTLGKTYAYVLQNNFTNQLQTIDVSNPQTLSPSDIKSTISFKEYGITSEDDADGKVITYYDGKLYIGLHTTIGPELLVFDISVDPSKPKYYGKIKDSFNHSINDIVIKGHYAYLAIAPGSDSDTTSELMIVDIFSSSTPKYIGAGYNATSSTNDTEAAITLYIIGNKLYMGREKVSKDTNEKNFYVLDISSSTNSTMMKSQQIVDENSKKPVDILDIVVQGTLGFLVTSDPDKPFQIYDVVSSSTAILPVTSKCKKPDLNLAKLIEIVYKNDLIYGANVNSAALNILHNEPKCDI